MLTAGYFPKGVYRYLKWLRLSSSFSLKNSHLLYLIIFFWAITQNP